MNHNFVLLLAATLTGAKPQDCPEGVECPPPESFDCSTKPWDEEGAFDNGKAQMRYNQVYCDYCEVKDLYGEGMHGGQAVWKARDDDSVRKHLLVSGAEFLNNREDLTSTFKVQSLLNCNDPLFSDLTADERLECIAGDNFRGDVDGYNEDTKAKADVSGFKFGSSFLGDYEGINIVQRIYGFDERTGDDPFSGTVARRTLAKPTACSEVYSDTFCQAFTLTRTPLFMTDFKLTEDMKTSDITLSASTGAEDQDLDEMTISGDGSWGNFGVMTKEIRTFERETIATGAKESYTASTDVFGYSAYLAGHGDMSISSELKGRCVNPGESCAIEECENIVKSGTLGLEPPTCSSGRRLVEEGESSRTESRSNLRSFLEDDRSSIDESHQPRQLDDDDDDEDSEQLEDIEAPECVQGCADACKANSKDGPEGICACFKTCDTARCDRETQGNITEFLGGGCGIEDNLVARAVETARFPECLTTCGDTCLRDDTVTSSPDSLCKCLEDCDISSCADGLKTKLTEYFDSKCYAKVEEVDDNEKIVFPRLKERVKYYKLNMYIDLDEMVESSSDHVCFLTSLGVEIFDRGSHFSKVDYWTDVDTRTAEDDLRDFKATHWFNNDRTMRTLGDTAFESITVAAYIDHSDRRDIPFYDVVTYSPVLKYCGDKSNSSLNAKVRLVSRLPGDSSDSTPFAISPNDFIMEMCVDVSEFTRGAGNFIAVDPEARMKRSTRTPFKKLSWPKIKKSLVKIVGGSPACVQACDDACDAKCNNTACSAADLITVRVSCARQAGEGKVKTACPEFHKLKDADRNKTDDEKSTVCKEFATKKCAKAMLEAGFGKLVAETCAPDTDALEKCLADNAGKGGARKKCLAANAKLLPPAAKAKLARELNNKEAKLMKEEFDKCKGDKRDCAKKLVKDIPEKAQAKFMREIAKTSAQDKIKNCSEKDKKKCLTAATDAIKELRSKKANMKDLENEVKKALAESTLDDLSDCVLAAVTVEEKRLCRKTARTAMVGTGVITKKEAKFFFRHSLVEAAVDAFISCKDDDKGTEDDCMAVTLDTFLQLGGNDGRWEKVKKKVERNYSNKDKEMVLRTLDSVDVSAEITGISKATFLKKKAAVATAIEKINTGDCNTTVTDGLIIEVEPDTTEADYVVSCTGDCCSKVDEALATEADSAIAGALETRRRLLAGLEVDASVAQSTEDVPVDDLNEDGSLPANYDVETGEYDKTSSLTTSTTTTTPENNFSGASPIGFPFVAAIVLFFF